MMETLQQFMGNPAAPVSSSTFVINMVLAGVLCAILAWAYVRFGHSLSNRRRFAQNFILLGMTTTFIITIVKSSLALSLGLVGALSIVRFRSAIKEPEELTYLFLALAIGLGLGANQAKATLISFVVVMGVIYLQSLRRAKQGPASMIMTVSTNQSPGLETGRIVEVIQRHCKGAELRRIDQTDSASEASFAIAALDFKDLMAVEQEIRTLNKNYRVSFIDNTGLI